MWVSDIINALEMIKEKQCCIEKIENGIIYLTDFSKYYIKDLLDKKDGI